MPEDEHIYLPKPVGALIMWPQLSWQEHFSVWIHNFHQQPYIWNAAVKVLQYFNSTK